ncbi:hypothetical protein PsalMR5_02912 [Piscirickettsia salmonis]|uniref:hypothetical protein n=1 Tax=Piscirickettsia salmonis TaxID=1238 RepID=UPI0012BA62B8|nr:hypothetical protein [Piscirickettsia salmonis]QGP55458.1 hypothetical protein PsalSR1_02904 [Piscirickettsia salmonis]QGP58698.1 hypothetical protein PsalBI1_01278 [Piscirickettsia salmonis]QGP65031.1 hypothetical protein PsalMR5_02912 [Piscirickettsia salmonis]
MPELTFLKIEGNHPSPTQLAGVVQEAADKSGEKLGKHYFDLQGQALAEGQLKGKGGPRKVLVAVDLVERAVGEGKEAQAEALARTKVKLSFFYQQLADTLPSPSLLLRKTLRANFDRLTCSEQRFSIIPIHKEMYFHVLRCVNAVTTNQYRARAAFEFAYHHIYQLINADIAEFLSVDDKNVRKLNQFIDKQRVKYATVAESMMMSHLLSPPAAELRKKSRKWLKTHTAADMDFIATNQLTGVLTHVTGCEQSSHSKKDQPAAMMAVDRYALARPDDAKPLQSQVKVPSLKEFKAEGPSITVSQQIQDFMVGYNLQGLGAPPVVYNLLTSLPRGKDSCGQRASAEKIFKGAHHYNATRVDTRMFYVMNLPINQHTQFLHYYGSKTQKEALLLADLTVFDAAQAQGIITDRAAILSINMIKQFYQDYLNREDREDFFSESAEGELAIEFSKGLKERINGGEVIQFSDGSSVDDEVLIKQALLKLYASKYSGKKVSDQKKYGSLAQALFLAVTNNHNFKGCKSANERFSYVENLNALLFAFKAGTLQGDIAHQMRDALTTYIQGGNERDFALMLHRINDRYNVYNAGVIPSCMDTGTQKCEINRGQRDGLGVGNWWNTNYFAANVYQNISQSRASGLQAHASKLQKRLGVLQKLTVAKLQSYKDKYAKFVDPRELVCKVIKDYVKSWGCRSHFKREGRVFLTQERLLEKNSSAVEDIQGLLEAVNTLQRVVQRSEQFSRKSTCNMRLLFLQQELQKHIEAEPAMELDQSTVVAAEA